MEFYSQVDATDAIKINVALIAAMASIAVGVMNIVGLFVTSFMTRHNQRDIEKLRDDYSTKAKDRDAARDYEYESKKRLYTECEPLLFQLQDHCSRTMSRIMTMSRVCEDEFCNRDTIQRWLDSLQNGPTTLYRLMAPLAILNCLHETVTWVDLALEPTIHRQYLLLRLMEDVYFHEDILAGLGKRLDYQPGSKAVDGLAPTAVFSCQGISPELLDRMQEVLVETFEHGKRVKPYPHFLAEAKVEQTAINTLLVQDLDYLLADISPLKRPVLWRVLIAQSFICEMLLNPSVIDSEQDRVPLTLEDYPDPPLAWKSCLPEEFAEHCAAAREFLEARLSRISDSMHMKGDRV